MPVQTIKGSRQKVSASGYSDYIPFGADGKYIDMLSGLDLEKELKLGGNHSAIIGLDSQNRTVITQKYADEDASAAYYKVITTIEEEADSTTITSQLHWIDSQENDILKNTKTITIQENGEQAEITEVLS